MAWNVKKKDMVEDAKCARRWMDTNSEARARRRGIVGVEVAAVTTGSTHNHSIIQLFHHGTPSLQIHLSCTYQELRPLIFCGTYISSHIRFIHSSIRIEIKKEIRR